MQKAPPQRRTSRPLFSRGRNATTSVDLHTILALANAKIEKGEPLSEQEVLAFARDMIAASTADMADNNLTPEVFQVPETLLKLRALIAAKRDPS